MYSSIHEQGLFVFEEVLWISNEVSLVLEGNTLRTFFGTFPFSTY